MKQKIYIYLVMLLSLGLACASCSGEKSAADTNIVFADGRYPYALLHNGTYYYTMQTPYCDSIIIYESPELKELPSARSRLVYSSADGDMHHYYSPELHLIDGKWYIYFEADNGNTDNHQLYVLENTSADPMSGSWELHGPIVTTDEWNFGIHPTSMIIKGKQYLLWSGWPTRRTESETQCIFIAEMENPWTLKSERVMLSKPEYEWERQWINPDGGRSAYPIFVNENPEAFMSPDGRNVIVTYSASGIWTIFNSLGMLHAPSDSDLLVSDSWTKVTEPQFVPSEGNPLFGASNITVVPSPDNTRQYMLYQSKHIDKQGATINDVRLKEITWSERSLPIFGEP